MWVNAYYHPMHKAIWIFVDVRHCFGLQETQAASADALPSQSFSRRINPSLGKSILLSENHHKVLVETDHTDRNILSFDAVWKPGCISPSGNPAITTQSSYYLTNLFFSVDIWHCCCIGRRMTQLPPMRFQVNPSLGESILLSESQSFSRKITTRYLLKLIIPIATYYHSTQSGNPAA